MLICVYGKNFVCYPCIVHVHIIHTVKYYSFFFLYTYDVYGSLFDCHTPKHMIVCVYVCVSVNVKVSVKENKVIEYIIIIITITTTSEHQRNCTEISSVFNIFRILRITLIRFFFFFRLHPQFPHFTSSHSFLSFLVPPVLVYSSLFLYMLEDSYYVCVCVCYVLVVVVLFPFALLCFAIAFVYMHTCVCVCVFLFIFYVVVYQQMHILACDARWLPIFLYSIITLLLHMFTLFILGSCVRAFVCARVYMCILYWYVYFVVFPTWKFWLNECVFLFFALQPVVNVVVVVVVNIGIVVVLHFFHFSLLFYLYLSIYRRVHISLHRHCFWTPKYREAIVIVHI